MRRLHPPNLRKALVREVCFGACLAGLLCLPLLAGCGGGNGNSSTPSTTSPTLTGSTGTTGGGQPDGTNSSFSLSQITATGLTASLSIYGNFSVGGTVTYQMTLTNSTSAAIPIHATSSPALTPAAQVVITGSNGAAVFKSPAIPPLAYRGTLAPGQSLSVSGPVTGLTAPGAYSAAAVFSDDTTAPQSVGPIAFVVPIPNSNSTD